MGRIIVIHPARGFLDMVKQTLEDTHQVEVFTKYQPAEERLAAGAACDAVLCGLDQPAAAIRVFERTCDGSPGARLILIAGDQNAANQFREQWDAVARRKKRKTTPDLEWLREPCTVSDILALFPPPSEASAKHSEAGPTARDEPEAEPHRTSPRSRLAGSVVDGYRLICPLGHTTGQGGSATTWMCVNETTEKLGAMKFVEGKDRMDQELRALRKYVHVAPAGEHLIQIEHINRDAAGLWFVTPLADSSTGGHTADSYRPVSLAGELQAKGHLPELEAVQVANGVARALLALNHAGLVHGDLGTGNILSVRRLWVLADPGLVRFLGEHRLCRNRDYYPELRASRPGDDLYALTLVLWETVSGLAEVPSGRDRMRLDGNLLSFLLKTDLPMAKFICRAADQNPERRYLNATEMLHDLESLAATLDRPDAAEHSLYNLPKLRLLRAS